MKRLLLILVISLSINSVYAIDMFVSTNDSLPADRMIKSCIQKESCSNDTSLKSYYLNKQLACINDVQKIYPDIPNVYYVRSQINLDLGNIEHAIADINNSSLSNIFYPKVYDIRIKLYLKYGKDENIDIIKSNIDKIFESDTKNYFSNFFGGNDNDYIWSLYDDKNISSYLVSSTYKYAIQKMEVKEGNIYTVPLIASYIQYIYNLEDTDSLFVKLGKNKEQILTSYIEAFEKQGGKYAAIVKGILMVASGDVKNGSDMINNNYLKNKDEYARKMIINSMSILKPKLTKMYSPGIKIKQVTDSPLIKHYEINSGLNYGSRLIAINGQAIEYYMIRKNLPQRQVEYMLNGGKDTIVNIEIEDSFHKRTTKTLKRTYPVEGYEYFVFTSDYNRTKLTEKKMMLMYPN